MYRSGHRGIVLLALAPVLTILFVVNRPVLALLAWSVFVIEPLPDYDHRVTRLEHRGTSHSLFTAGVVGVCCGVLGWLIGTYITVPLVDWLLSGIVSGPKAIAWMKIHLSVLNAIMLALIGFCVGAGGIMLHLVGDMITRAGIQPLLPFSQREVSLTSLYADNVFVNRGLLGLGVVAIIAVGVFMTPFDDRLLAVFGLG